MNAKLIFYKNFFIFIFKLPAITGVLCDYYVCERMTLNWSQTCEVVWTYGQRDLKIINESNPIYEELGDISRIMRRRALQGYGLKASRKINLSNSCTSC